MLHSRSRVLSSSNVQSSLENSKKIPSVEEDLEAARRLIAFTRFHRWLSYEHTNLEQLIERLQVRVAQQRAIGKIEPPLAPVEIIDEVELIEPHHLDEETRPVLVASSTEKITVQSEMVQANTEAVPHPLEIDYDSDKRGPVREPIRQRLTANLLKSFMEQSNIRWIELISASLIVICSVGLVISLWSTLSSTSRFFPSLVFLVATIAVHGAGQYTLKQWKLRTTSRGILHIGLMLIPLAVLIGILLSRRPDGPPAVDMLVASIIGVGTLVYGALAVTASRSLFSRRWVNVASLIVVSSSNLLPIHFLGEHQRLQQDQSILVRYHCSLFVWGLLLRRVVPAYV